MNADLIIHNALQLITCSGSNAPRRGIGMQELGIIDNGAIAISGENILAVGSSSDITRQYKAAHEIDAVRQVVCPGFVEPHTHVAYAGDRIDEFEMRIKGVSYMDIMAAGGGIAATTRATRAASHDQIVAETKVRLDTMLELGTTTTEVKSGYGLNNDTELKLMQVIADLHTHHAMDLVPTFMAAHAVPDEFSGNADGYIDHIIRDMLPAVAAWYETSVFNQKEIPLFIDVFCEQNAFNVKQANRVLSAGKKFGMLVKAHVDEFSPLGGVQMALELGAVSVDHLDVTPESDFKLLTESGAVAVVIPAVNFNLGSQHFANARSIIDAGAAIALTTDINPGSSPCPSMPLVMAIACRYQRLLPSEALVAGTINAAFAIAMADRIGSLESGKQADVLIIDAPDYRHLAYQFGSNLVSKVIKRGRIVYDAGSLT